MEMDFEKLNHRNWSLIRINPIKGSKITKEWVKELKKEWKAGKVKLMDEEKEKNLMKRIENYPEGWNMFSVWSYFWNQKKVDWIKEHGKGIENDKYNEFLIPFSDLDKIDSLPQSIYKPNVEWEIKVVRKRLKEIPLHYILGFTHMMVWNNGWENYQLLNDKTMRKVMMF